MSRTGEIAQSYRRIRNELPDGVTIVAAAKTRSADEIREVIDAGASVIGENYVQEGRDVRRELGEMARTVRWDMIGHLQSNKINDALRHFDLVQTVDRMKVARGINKRVNEEFPVYVQVNIGEESTKYGVMPDEAEELVQEVARMDNLCVKGLMTMEPYFDDPEKARPYFRRMKELYDCLRDRNIPGLDLDVLSMGMTNSFRVAVDEGANMVRIGTAIFGPR